MSDEKQELSVDEIAKRLEENKAKAERIKKLAHEAAALFGEGSSPGLEQGLVDRIVLWLSGPIPADAPPTPAAPPRPAISASLERVLALLSMLPEHGRLSAAADWALKAVLAEIAGEDPVEMVKRELAAERRYQAWQERERYGASSDGQEAPAGQSVGELLGAPEAAAPTAASEAAKIVGAMRQAAEGIEDSGVAQVAMVIAAYQCTAASGDAGLASSLLKSGVLAAVER